MLAEVGDGVAEIVEQQGGHVAADAQADQDALDGDVGGGSGEGSARAGNRGAASFTDAAGRGSQPARCLLGRAGEKASPKGP